MKLLKGKNKVSENLQDDDKNKTVMQTIFFNGSTTSMPENCMILKGDWQGHTSGTTAGHGVGRNNESVLYTNWFINKDTDLAAIETKLESVNRTAHIPGEPNFWQDVDDHDRWTSTRGLGCFDLRITINQINYFIPDLWWFAAEEYASGQGGGFSWSHQYLYSNWQRYTPVPTYKGKSSGPVEFYAYKDGWFGDQSQPVVLTLTVDGGKDGGSWAELNFAYLDDIVCGSPAYFNYELDLKLARKRLADPSYDVRRLMLDPNLKNGSKLVYTTNAITSLSSNQLEVKETTMSNFYADYVSTSVLRNDQPETAVTLKTSDYKHSYTDTTATQTSWSIKTTSKINVKVGGKLTESVLGAAGLDITAEFSYERTDAGSVTNTKAETREFTVSGQSVAIPKNSIMSVDTQWFRAKAAGVAMAYFPSNGLTSTVAPTDHWDRNSIQKIDIDVARADLGVQSLQYRDGGTQFYGEFHFQADVGVMGNFSVTPLGLVVPDPPRIDSVQETADSNYLEVMFTVSSYMNTKNYGYRVYSNGELCQIHSIEGIGDQKIKVVVHPPKYGDLTIQATAYSMYAESVKSNGDKAPQSGMSNSEAVRFVKYPSPPVLSSVTPDYATAGTDGIGVDVEYTETLTKASKVNHYLIRFKANDGKSKDQETQSKDLKVRAYLLPGAYIVTVFGVLDDGTVTDSSNAMDLKLDNPVPVPSIEWINCYYGDITSGGLKWSIRAGDNPHKLPVRNSFDMDVIRVDRPSGEANYHWTEIDFGVTSTPKNTLSTGSYDIYVYAFCNGMKSEPAISKNISVHPMY